LELEHLPRLEHCLDPSAHLVIASIDGLLYRRWTGRHPLDVLRPQVKPHVEFAPVPSFDASAQQFHVLLRHRLPPFLDEALGGSTGLVDIEIVGALSGDAIHPLADLRVAPLDPAGARCRPTGLNDHRKGDSAAEVEYLLGSTSNSLKEPIQSSMKPRIAP
jgi:hypothetical protein